MKVTHPFGLALSGGGFRAAAYHLGVLRRLRELGLLAQVDVMSTVSGGSIAGAYWVYWQAFKGDTLADGEEWARFETSLIDFMRSGVRERIFRKGPALPGAFSDDDIRRYKEAMSRPGALTAMLNYYRTFGRNLGRGSGAGSGTQTVSRPTLVIWGERDTALNLHNLDGLEDYVPDLRIERLPDASHWVLADAPERVSELMIRFLRGEG